MWKLCGGRKGLKQLKMETQISGRLTAHGNVTEDLKTGRSTGRFFGCTLGRSVFSLLLAAVLVLSDALPIPGGLPDTVKADNYPRKGTITFYEYKAITSSSSSGTLLHGDNSYRDTLMIYQIDGTWYAPNSKILGDNNWPVGKVTEMIPHFDAEALTFHSRVKSFFKRRDYEKWSIYTYPMFFRTYSPDGSYMTLINSLPSDGNRIMPGNGTCYPFGIYGTYDDGKFLSYSLISLYNHDGMTGWGPWLRGNTSVIAGSGSDYTFFRFYDVSTYTYTCINSNYTIGENQVYVADRDLFLREGVKLTIPEGSVLCVKNGPFYVNGEIECYGTILVEDGGIIMPYESTDAGSRIVMKEGGAMIIRKGGKVYAGCPKGSLWTSGDNGWLDMYAGSSIINFGLLIAGQCNFKYGQATLENHKGGAMFLGYTVDNTDESHFVNASVNADLIQRTIAGQTDVRYYFGAGKTNGQVHYGEGTNQTVIKTWDGALTMFANKNSSSGKTVKSYSYDKDGKSTVKTDFSPN